MTCTTRAESTTSAPCVRETTAGSRPEMTAGPPDARPQVPLRRLFLLTLLTAAIAFALQATLAATSAPSANAISLLVIPVPAGAVIFFGLRPYPLGGRLGLGV